MKKTLDVSNLKPFVVEGLRRKLKGKGYTTTLEKKNLIITTKNKAKNIRADIDAVVKKIVDEVK